MLANVRAARLGRRGFLGMALVAMVLTFVPASSAQPRQGDLLLSSVSGTTGVFSVDWATGNLNTIRAGVPVATVQTAYGNGSIIASRAPLPTTRILRLTGSGLETTLISFAGTQNPRGWAIDQDGTYIFGSSDNRLYRLPLNGGSVSTFAVIPASGSRFVNAMCRDGERGFFIVGTAGPNQLLRVNRVTRAVTTLAAALPAATLTGVDYVPSEEEYVVATLSRVYFVNTSGGVRGSLALQASMVTCDERMNRIFVTDISGGVHELDTTGTVIRSRTYAGFAWTGLDVFEDQNVSLTGLGTAGSMNTISLAFKRSPNRPYCVAVSGEPRPSLVFGGQYLNLRLDSVFALTVCSAIPGFTSNFSGVTDSGGTATATLTIPGGVPAGVRLFIGAVAFNPAAPGGFDVGNMELLLTR